MSIIIMIISIRTMIIIVVVIIIIVVLVIIIIKVVVIMIIRGYFLENLTVCFVPVSDADADVEGAPGAPLDVRCLDANKDYIIVTWKQPAIDGGHSILGYFVDRSVDQTFQGGAHFRY